jgi:chaperonin GroES
MKVTADNKLKKLIVVGDRVLIRPAKQTDQTDSGLYLPPRRSGERKNSEWICY